MNDFGQALQTASPFLLGLGAQLQGRDPNGISSGLAQMQEEAEKARRKSAIADLMGQMGIGGSKAALLDMLPFEAQAQMLMQEQQRMEGAAELDNLYGALYGGYSDGGGASGGYGTVQPTGGTTTQEVMGSRVSAPNMGGIASGPLNPTPSQPNYVAPEDIGNVAPEHAAAKAALVAGGEPGSAVSYAARMLNKGEAPNRAELQKYMETGGAGMDPKTAAWCAAFVNASLGHAGIQGTGKMNARSFLEWGQPVDKPEPGDIAVFSRGDPNGWQGHVGFFQGYDENGNIKVLGGNQGDAVTVQAYPKDRLLGFRRAGESAPKQQDDNVTRRALLQGMRSNDPGVRAFAQMEYEKRFGQQEFDASRYKVVGDTLVDLMAPGGPAVAFQGDGEQDLPAQVRALQWRAEQAGLVPGTEAYSQFMINGGAQKGMSLTVGPNGEIRFTQGGAQSGGTTVGQAYNPGEARSTVDLIDEILTDPNLSRVTGPIEGGGGNDVEEFGMARRAYYGSGGIALIEKVNQLQSRAWLAARDMLKGGGPITDYESRKAEAAVARLNRAKDDADYKKALTDLRDAITEGMAKLEAAQGGGQTGDGWTEIDGVRIREKR